MAIQVNPTTALTDLWAQYQKTAPGQTGAVQPFPTDDATLLAFLSWVAQDPKNSGVLPASVLEELQAHTIASINDLMEGVDGDLDYLRGFILAFMLHLAKQLGVAAELTERMENMIEVAAKKNEAFQLGVQAGHAFAASMTNAALQAFSGVVEGFGAGMSGTASRSSGVAGKKGAQLKYSSSALAVETQAKVASLRKRSAALDKEAGTLETGIAARDVERKKILSEVNDTNPLTPEASERLQVLDGLDASARTRLEEIAVEQHQIADEIHRLEAALIAAEPDSLQAGFEGDIANLESQTQAQKATLWTTFARAITAAGDALGGGVSGSQQHQADLANAERVENEAVGTEASGDAQAQERARQAAADWVRAFLDAYEQWHKSVNQSVQSIVQNI